MSESGATPATHKRTCCLCEATCGLEITTQGQGAEKQILSIKGDKYDPFSRGYICPKATALQDLHDDPDRLTQPVKKMSDGRWKTISWKQAIREGVAGLKGVQNVTAEIPLAVIWGIPTFIITAICWLVRCY